MGGSVTVLTGPYAQHTGTITQQQGDKVSVLVNIYGVEKTIELSPTDIETMPVE